MPEITKMGGKGDRVLRAGEGGGPSPISVGLGGPQGTRMKTCIIRMTTCFCFNSNEDLFGMRLESQACIDS